MKLNKLLTPILGLATVSTVVAPIATSCTSETVAHVKVSSKSEEVTSNDKKATYLLVLDRNDYDQHGFRVTTTVSKDDKTGVVSDDFECDWEIDGDHLTVCVEYVGEYVPENDVTVKLNINVSYGTEWKETLGVKFGYVIDKGTELVYDINQGTKQPCVIETASHAIKPNKQYKYYFDFAKYLNNEQIYSFLSQILGSGFCFRPSTKIEGDLPAIFKTVKGVINDETTEYDFNLFGHTSAMSAQFGQALYEKAKDKSLKKATFIVEFNFVDTSVKEFMIQTYIMQGE